MTLPSYEVKREAPALPPVKNITITLSLKEFQEMWDEVSFGLYEERETYRFFQKISNHIHTGK